MPIVLLGGRLTPPSNVTVPLVRPSRLAKIDRRVDFPALFESDKPNVRIFVNMAKWAAGTPFTH